MSRLGMDDWDEMANDLFDSPYAESPVDMAVASRPRLQSALFKVPCPRCGGSGRYSDYHGACFRCNGVGYQTVKTDPAILAANRAKDAERKAAKATTAAAKHWEAFQAQHPAVAAWMDANTHFDFANSLRASVQKWGGLTAAQLAAAERCVERARARDEERAQAKVSAPEAVGASKLEEAFAKAHSHLKWPKVRVAEFVFKPAGPNGLNAGAIYVTDAKRTGDDGKPLYLGKVMGGRLQLLRDAKEREAEVLKVLADPAAAATAYGLEFGQCSCCGRELTNKESIERGIGPICAERFGW